MGIKGAMKKNKIFFSRGEISFMDVVLELFEKRIVPCEILFATWRIGKRDIEAVREMSEIDGVDIKLLVDVSMQNVSRRGEWEMMQEEIGCRVWLTKNHAKIFAMSPDVVMLTSANMNKNTRLEVFSIFYDKTLFKQIKSGLAPYFSGLPSIEYFDRPSINAEFDGMDIDFDFDI
jgi:hypothetical protein